MSRLGEIPVIVEFRDDVSVTGTIGGGVSAILAEILEHVDALARDGEPAAIDLRSLPMSPNDRNNLIAALGDGEVAIALSGDGESTIRETGIGGVWWHAYRDREGEMIAEFIEIAAVPAIVPADTADMRGGARRLRARLAGVRRQ